MPGMPIGPGRSGTKEHALSSATTTIVVNSFKYCTCLSKIARPFKIQADYISICISQLTNRNLQNNLI